MPVLAAFAVPHPPLAVPAVGRGREAQISETVEAYRQVARRVGALAPDTVVPKNPHAELYLDYSHIALGRGATGDLAQFGAAGERVETAYDAEFASTLAELARGASIPAGPAGERDPSLDHATMVPLHFILERYQAFRLVRLGLSGLSPLAHYRLGQQIRRTSNMLGRRVVFVASGDLSHKLLADGPYGFAPEGPRLDAMVCDAFRTGNFDGLLQADPSLCERAAECGLRSFQIMAGSLDRTPVRPELLSYSGVLGVGYAVAAFTPVGPEGSAPERNFGQRYEAWHTTHMARIRREEDPWVELARRAAEAFVRTGQEAGAESLLAAMDADGRLPGPARAELASTRAGCFVSTKRDGRLRGCIGTIAPARPTLAEEICANAASAVARDPRFSPVGADELRELVYGVDVLGLPEAVEGAGELDCRRYGVIVSCEDGRRGLLLPDLDGVDTVEEQLAIAARKGGIDLAHDGYALQRFEVVRHR